MTDKASRTKTPPATSKTTSCLAIKLTVPSNEPRANEPVSPIKILAGGALYHKKPRQDPTIAPQKIETSPAPGIN